MLGDLDRVRAATARGTAAHGGALTRTDRSATGTDFLCANTGIDTPHNGTYGTDFLILVLILPIIMVIMVLMLPIAVRILLMSVLILPIIIGPAHFLLHGRRLWPLR
jgi:hypothetical protein